MYKIMNTMLIIILLGALFMSVSGNAATISPDGYVVSPAEPGDRSDLEPLDIQPVEAGDVPPQILFIFSILIALPLAAFPVQLFLLGKMFMYLGYRKISGKIALENSTRSMIFMCIRDNPGINFSSIARRTGITPGTLRYHLGILTVLRKISLLKSLGHTRYFENSGRFSDNEKKVLKFIRNDTDNQILRLLFFNPGISRQDLEEVIGISGPTVTWYINRLSDAKIISVMKSGRYIKYKIDPDVHEYLEKYLLRDWTDVNFIVREKIIET
jgi:predicted transcriptional regulator